jgi:acetyl-CoA carboxylase carboxyltransferase component
MITRPSNANKHPGDIQRLSGARRPKEVVAAERTAKAAVKEKAAAAKESAIQKVARIENDARKKHTSSRLASHVADKLTIPRVARARKTIDEQGGISHLDL